MQGISANVKNGEQEKVVNLKHPSNCIVFITIINHFSPIPNKNYLFGIDTVFLFFIVKNIIIIYTIYLI